MRDQSTRRLETEIDSEHEISIAYNVAGPRGAQKSLVYVHGWGCSKGDFDGAAIDPVLSRYRRLSFDFPGHGESTSPNTGLTIGNIVSLMREVIVDAEFQAFTLIGHNIGGLVAGRYAQKYDKTVVNLVNIEGNLIADDCFLTGEVAAGRETRESLIEKYRDNTNPGFRRYAEHLARVNDKVLTSLAASTVAECADNSPYLDFKELERPRLFVYGDESRDSISYLSDLTRGNKDFDDSDGVQVYEVPGASHFPAIDNPGAFYGAIGSFIANA